jgi:hypothetical protein
MYDGQSKVPGIPLLIAFFDVDGLVLHVFVPPGQSVTSHFSVKVLHGQPRSTNIVFTSTPAWKPYSYLTTVEQ